MYVDKLSGSSVVMPKSEDSTELFSYLGLDEGI